MKEADQYIKIVQWSEENGCYVGTCPGLMDGGIHGDDEVKVYRELCKAVEEWIRIYRRDGFPLPPPTADRSYSGKFLLRVGENLHQQLYLQALRDGESLNSYCVKKLMDK